MRPKNNGQAKRNAGPNAKASSALFIKALSLDKKMDRLQELCWDLAQGIVEVLSKSGYHRADGTAAEDLKELIAFGPGELSVDEPLWRALLALHSVDRFICRAKMGQEDMLDLLRDIPKAVKVRDSQWIINRRLDRLEMLLDK